MFAIYKRELRAYFTSMIGPVFIAVLVFMTGIYFMHYNMNYGYPYFSYTLQAILYLVTFIVPILTMRSMSEERRLKTDQILLTSPVTVSSMIIGKYLAMVTVVAIPCLIFCACPLIIASTGTAFFAIDYSAIFAFFILCCAYVAVGMFVSSLTESMIISAVGTIGILFLSSMMSGLASYLPTAALPSMVVLIAVLTVIALIFYLLSKNWVTSLGIEIVGVIVMLILYTVKSEIYESCLSNFLTQLSLSEVYYNFSQSYVFDVAGLVKLVSIAGICLFLTGQAVQKRRWS